MKIISPTYRSLGPVTQKGIESKIYRDGNTLYVWNNATSSFVAISGGGGSAVWGGIGGTLGDQTDLAAALNLLAPKASPALTGNPTAPTQSVGNNSTRLATTAFVQSEISSLARIPSLNTHGSTITHTGTTAETIVHSELIPAGTFQAGDLLEFFSLISATSNANNKTFRLYTNTSIAIPSSTNLFATYIASTAGVYAYFQRLIFFQGLSSQVVYSKTANAPGSYNANSSGYSFNTVDFSINQYMIITVQLANAADNAYIYGIKSTLQR